MMGRALVWLHTSRPMHLVWLLMLAYMPWHEWVLWTVGTNAGYVIVYGTTYWWLQRRWLRKMGYEVKA